MSPPVVETVMGVQFAPFENFRIQHYGMLWDSFKPTFESIEEHERLQPIIESREISGPVMAWRLIAGVQMPRVWLLGKPGDTGQYILQVQDDRFLMNWRTSKEDGQDYPSHKKNRELFSSYLQSFLTFVDELKLGRFEPEQCELTYINHIRVTEKSPPISVAADAFTFLSLPPVLTGIDENFNFNSSSWCEELPGRVYASLQSARHRETKEPILEFRLTARGASTEKTSAGVINWLDKGHTIIKRSFTSLTDKKMHNKWGV